MAAPIRECMWLVRHGVPFDVAFRLDDITRTAFSIIVSEQGGSVFDWNAMRFRDDK